MMGLIGHLLAVICRVVAVAMELLILILAIRFARPHIQWHFIAALDEAAGPVLSAFAKGASRSVFFRGKGLSESAVLGWCLIALLLFQLAVVALG